MASFGISILKHQKRADHRYPISIRVSHKKDKSFIFTGYYATSKQVNSKFKLKDAHLLSQIYEKIQTYEALILPLNLDLFNSKQIAEYVTEQTRHKDSLVDFTEFARSYIIKIKPKQPSRARRLSTTLSSFEDYFNRKTIFASEITAKVLNEYAGYLKTDRELKRVLRTKETILKKPAMSDSSVRDFLGDIRTLFNECKKKYNDDEKGINIVKNDPFLKFVMPKKREVVKRSLDPDSVRRIFSLPDYSINGHSGGSDRCNLARDVWCISFLLIGANTADLYFMEQGKTRISYNRRKTAARREDEALISIKIEKELMPYLKKYKDPERLFSFHRLYSDFQSFNSAVNKGLKYVSGKLGIGAISSYSARHSWATIARNECGVSKDDIHLCLNHVDKENRVTDLYIKKDWSLVDKANRKVIDYLFKPVTV